MPIGTIIGFLIGTLIIGLLMSIMNRKYDRGSPIEVIMMAQNYWMLGTAMASISALALIGTFVEMAGT
jgi:hypothetical protein